MKEWLWRHRLEAIIVLFVVGFIVYQIVGFITYDPASYKFEPPGYCEQTNACGP